MPSLQIGLAVHGSCYFDMTLLFPSLIRVCFQAHNRRAICRCGPIRSTKLAGTQEFDPFAGLPLKISVEVAQAAAAELRGGRCG